MRKTLSVLATLVLPALWACGAKLDHSNPYDPGTPAALQQKGSLSGIVTLEQESDFSGTIVGLADTSIQTQTNADGTFLLTGIPAGRYDLLLTRTSYQAQTVRGINYSLGATGGQTIGSLALLLKRAPFQGGVTLQGATNNGGALVTLTRTGRAGAGAPPQGLAGLAATTAPVVLSTLTDAGGAYQFGEVPAGTFTLTLTKEGFSPLVEQGIQVTGDQAVQESPFTLLPLVGNFLINQGAAFTNQPTVTLSFSVQNVAKIIVSENAGFGGGATWQTYAGTMSYVLSAGDGLKTVWVAFQDPFGDQTAPQAASIFLKTRPPASPFLQINNGAAFTNQAIVTLGFSVSGASEMSIGNTPLAADTGWIAYQPGLAWTLFVGDGVKTVYARYRDEAGNLAGPVSASITLLTQPPQGPSAVVNGGASFTNQANVTLTCAATGAVEMEISADSAFAGASWIPFASLWPWTLGGAGLQVVYVRFRDAAGNKTAPVAATITVDTTPPSAPSISVAGGSFVTTTAVNLVLSATDAGSGMASMDLGNDVGFSGAGDVLRAPYATAYPNWALSAGDGAKTVYARFYDRAGNVSAIASTQVTVDSTPPGAGSVVIDGGAVYTDTQAVALSLNATGADLMRFGGEVAGPSGWMPYAPTPAVQLAPGLGAKGVSVTYEDLAGNLSATTWAAITYVNPPTVYGVVRLSGVTDATGVSISLGGGAPLSTGTSGAYSFTSNAPLGLTSLTFSKPNYDGASLPLSIAVGSDVAVPTVTLDPSSGGIAGVAQLQGAGGAAGIMVTLTGTSVVGRTVALTTSTDGQGNYGFSGVPVGSGYTVMASMADYLTSYAGASVQANQTTNEGPLTLAQNLSGGVTGYAYLEGATSAGNLGIAVNLTGTNLYGVTVNVSQSTNSLGLWSFTGLAGGTYTLTWTATNYDGVSSGIGLPGGQGVQAPPMTLRASRGSLSGIALLQGAGGAAGIAVTLSGASSIGQPVTMATLTDASGSYGFTGVLVGSGYSVSATATNYDQAVQTGLTVLAGQTTPVVPLTLNQNLSGTITGYVYLAGATSNGNIGITVTLSGTTVYGTTFTASAPVAGDGSGLFSLSNLPGGNYILTYSTVDYDGNSSGVALLAGQGIQAPPVTLQASLGSISGVAQLQGASTSGGIAVTLSGIAAIGRPVTLATSTDAGGNYSLAGVFVGSTYTIIAASPNYASQSVSSVSVVANQNSSIALLTLPQNTSGSVTGYAYLQGATGGGNAGIVVTLSGTSVYGTPFSVSNAPLGTGATGFFSLSGIPGGNYVLTYSATNFDGQTVSTALLPGQALQSPTINLNPSRGAVVGTAQLQGASNHAGISVSLGGTSAIGTPVTLSATTDVNGNFSLTGVLVGNYAMWAVMPNYVSQPLSSVQVSANGTVTANFPLLTVSTGTVTGYAVLALGPCATAASSAGIGVGLSGTDFRGTVQTFSSSTSVTGYFTFSAVPPGVYSVLAAAPNYSNAATSNLSVTPGGVTSAGTLNLMDTLPPTAPHITTPSTITNASSLALRILAATDPTIPSNLAGYQKLGGTYSTWTNATATEDAQLVFNFDLNTTNPDGQNNTLQIRAIDCAGNAGPADFVNITYDSVPPNGPTNLHVENRNGRVDISWTASASADTAGYLLYYGAVNSPNPSDYAGSFAAQGASPIAVGNVAHFSLTGLQNGTPFYVALVAYDSVPNFSLLTAALEADPNAYPINLVGTIQRGTGEIFNSVALVTDYAYVTLGNQPFYNPLNGLRIYDIGIPTAPTMAGFYNSATAALYGLAVSYPYAIVTARDFSTSNVEVQVIDAHSPDAPTVAGRAFLYTDTNGYYPGEYDPIVVQWPYAYVGAYRQMGLVIFDISDPSKPVRIANYNPGGDSFTREVQVYGKYAYVAGQAIHVVDVSNPAAPVQAGQVSGSAGYYYNLAVAWPYLYSLGTFGSFFVFNISNPAAPTLVSTTGVANCGNCFPSRLLAFGPLLTAGCECSSPFLIDAQNPSTPTLVGRMSQNQYAKRMAIKGSLLAMTDSYSGGLDLYTLAPRPPVPAQGGTFSAGTYSYTTGFAPWLRMGIATNKQSGLNILDVSTNPNAPTQWQAYSLPGAVGVYADRSTAYAYVPQSVYNSGTGFNDAQLTAIDISNPANPTPANGSVSMAGCPMMNFANTRCDCSAYQVDVQGGFAYVATGLGGIAVVDVRIPQAPTLLGRIGTPTCSLEVETYGPDMYVADVTATLRYDIRNPSAPVLLAGRPGTAIGHVSVSGGRVYATGGEHASWPPSTLITVMNSQDLSVLGALDLSPFGGFDIEQMNVAWPYAYVAEGYPYYRLWVIDVTNPASMKVVGVLGTEGGYTVQLNGPFAFISGETQWQLVQLE